MIGVCVEMVIYGVLVLVAASVIKNVKFMSVYIFILFNWQLLFMVVIISSHLY